MTEHAEVRAFITNPALQRRLAKYMVLQCFRNSVLEDLHAGTSPSSASGDYSDVTVSSPYGVIPWPRVSRLNDHEVKRLMIDVVDRTYRFIHTLFDENTGGQVLLRLAKRDPVPHWNEPTLRDDSAEAKVTADVVYAFRQNEFPFSLWVGKGKSSARNSVKSPERALAVGHRPRQAGNDSIQSVDAT